jgi:diaminohydroxyphosphoribosylaminopyrimidine deaminase/5-amino-6-(5-phosphoribosylamino)uracil reductase
MDLSSQDEVFLARALERARNGVVLGEGAHDYDRFDHAEIAALKEVFARGGEVSGATAYVTLEPCSHHGRTGPCAVALIEAGIARCVIATVDPNPQVSGRGLATMRAAGIEVVVLEPSAALAHETRRLNEAFAFSIQHGRPFVTLKAALSVDGTLGPSSQTGRGAPFWLTGPAARGDVQIFRHASDAILTGSGTLRDDDPSLTDRTGLPRRRPLLRVVLDSALHARASSKIVENIDNDLLFVVAGYAPMENCVRMERRGAEVLFSDGNSSLETHAAWVLQQLHKRDIRSVLLEGGTSINTSFLGAGLVDRVVFYFSETEVGGNAIPFANNMRSPYVLQQELFSVTRQTFPNGRLEDVRIMGYLHDPWLDVPDIR